MPTESAATVAARNRQILDLAKLDEDENRRVKQMRTVTRGVRAFRGIRSSATAARGASKSVGGTGNSTGNSWYDGQVSLLNHFMSGGS